MNDEAVRDDVVDQLTYLLERDGRSGEMSPELGTWQDWSTETERVIALERVRVISGYSLDELLAEGARRDAEHDDEAGGSA